MALSEEAALSLLQELMKRPDLENVARIYRELLQVHNEYFPFVQLAAAAAVVGTPVEAAAAAIMSDLVAELPAAKAAEPAPTYTAAQAEKAPAPAESDRLPSGRRRKAGSVHGWPKGVTQKEYFEWKTKRLEEGYTGPLHPAVYQAVRDNLPIPNVAPPRVHRQREMARARAKLSEVTQKLNEDAGLKRPRVSKRSEVEHARDRRKSTEPEPVQASAPPIPIKQPSRHFRASLPHDQEVGPTGAKKFWDTRYRPKVSPEIESLVRGGALLEERLTFPAPLPKTDAPQTPRTAW
jgi:hypothetical protein